MQTNSPIMQYTTTKFLFFQAVPKNTHTITMGRAEIPSAVAGIYMALPGASHMNYENILQLDEQIWTKRLPQSQLMYLSEHTKSSSLWTEQQDKRGLVLRHQILQKRGAL